MIESVRIRAVSLVRPDDEVTRLYRLLAFDERLRADKFFKARDRRRFIVSRATLRILLGEQTGTAPESIELCILPGGKPAFADSGMRRNHHFNVSHCGELALFAFADREIGIDVERVRPFADMSRVAAHFFSPREAADFEQLDENERARFFYRTWVRKEAYVKATGKGFAIEPSSVNITAAPGGFTMVQLADGSQTVDNEYAVHDLSDIDDHVAAVAIGSSGH